MMQAYKPNTKVFWILWVLLTIGLSGYFYYAINSDETQQFGAKGIFLPGKTTHGHHQIEMACSLCHVESFGGKNLMQDACVNCHEAELKRIDDSHPKKKFTDPRNADIVEKIDARYCVACHVEHRPEMTNEMGVTQPDNFCFHCHAEIAEERPTHKDLGFETCASSGCHNFHDNKALYEEYLFKNRKRPDHLKRQTVDERDLLSFLSMSTLYPADRYPVKALELEQADAPVEHLNDQTINNDWLSTRHAAAGVNCSACHQAVDAEGKQSEWTNKPDHNHCKAYHIGETDSFLEGKHGMRLAANLPAMTPADARLPMKPDSHDKALNCTTCHQAHRFETKNATVDACLQCHDDEHSRHYKNSPHAKLWQAEQSGDAPANSGVTCATCHMPRIWHENAEELERIMVDHNQNNTLRPNEKMLRPVCKQCHGLKFSIDALADPVLIKNNFNGSPSKHIESIDMTIEVDRLHQLKRQQEKQVSNQ